MTFRELFSAEHGYDISDEAKKNGIYPCPSKFGYEVKNPTICRRLLDCKSCWEREVPQKEPTKWRIEKVQKAADAAKSVREEVNHPSHYAGKFECIDVMEDIYGKQAVIDFCLCNAFKYLWRSKQKHETPLTDLKKAKFYIDWAIDKLEEKSEQKEVLQENMICPKCGKVMKRENNLICTSYPPKYQYTCDNCGQVEYRVVPNYYEENK